MGGRKLKGVGIGAARWESRGGCTVVVVRQDLDITWPGPFIG